MEETTDESKSMCTLLWEAIEDEFHILLDCAAFKDLRMLMFRSIRRLTGNLYDVAQMMDDRWWMIDFLIGNCVLNVKFRESIYRQVGKFLSRAMVRRRAWLEI